MNRFLKVISTTLAVSIMATAVPTVVLASNHEIVSIRGNGKHYEETNTAVTEILEHYKGKKEATAMQIIALLNYSLVDPNVLYQNIKMEVKERDGIYLDVENLEQVILLISALGYNAQEIAGYNLVEQLANKKFENRDTKTVAFALIALNCNTKYKVSDAVQENLISILLERMNQDGGFYFSKEEMESDIEMTAYAVQALAKYKEDKKVDTAITKALNYLDRKQKRDGNFETTEEMAETMIALLALGKSPVISKFTETKGDLITAILSNQEKDMFRSTKEGVVSESATDKVLLAFCAYHQYLMEENWIYDYSGTEKIEILAPIQDFVQEAKKSGLMQGRESGFEENANITRAEFLKVMDHLVGFKTEGESYFQDVEKEDWFYDVITKAYTKGYVNGYEDGTFRPDEFITRQEAATIIGRIFGSKLIFENRNTVYYNNQSELPDWARDSITLILETGIMHTECDAFWGEESITRGECARIAVMLAKVNHKYLN